MYSNKNGSFFIQIWLYTEYTLKLYIRMKYIQLTTGDCRCVKVKGLVLEWSAASGEGVLYFAASFPSLEHDGT